jgi:hypothetical protein
LAASKDAADDYYKKQQREHRMPLRGLIAAFVLGVLATQARAADPIGYAEAFDTLYSIDLVTHQATEIGRATPQQSTTRYANIAGLTSDPKGVLYGVSDAGATKTLLMIDPTTGLATPVGNLNVGSSQQLDLGLAFTCDGAMWMSARTGDLWRVDPATASLTHIGNLGVIVTGLAASGNKLYAAGSQGNNNLYAVDTATANAILVGSYGSSNYITVTSFAFDGSGKIWAVLDYVPPQSDSSPVKQWSDLAQLSLRGVMNAIGSITPAQSQSAPDLEYIGLKGLAIPSGVCAPAPAVASTPALSWYGFAALVLLLALLGGTRARRCHQNI